MKRQGFSMTAALAVLGLIAAASSPAFSLSRSVAVPMRALSGSGERGSALFTQLPTGVRVVIALHNAPLRAQPAHIHSGSCAAPRPAPAFALNDIVNGRSVSFLPGVKISALLGDDAVVVHQGLRHMTTYVSCGNIR